MMQPKTNDSDTEVRLRDAIHQFQKLEAQFDERVRERTKEFEERETRLQEAAEQIKRTELRERERLASLLHDHVQQLLIAAKLRIGAVADELSANAGNVFSEVMSLLDGAINVTRDVSVQLTPPLLHDQGLPAAIEWLISRTIQQFRLIIKPQIDTSADPSTQDGRDILFQAAQEFLLNVAKHAQCQEAKLRLSRSKKQITLKVSDRGVGFDASQLRERGSYGLFELEGRLKSIGGEFKIDSQLGKGTSATAIVPI